jgi:nucleotide-binding universal stress UspA family protein
VSTDSPNELNRPAPWPDRSAGIPDAGATTVAVVGFDGSDTSWDALWWACGETERLCGGAVAVFVSPSSNTSMFVASVVLAGAPCDYATLDKVATDQAEQLRQQVERYAADHDIRVRFVHARGDATTELLRIAAEHHADLIVVGRSMKSRHHIAGSLGGRLIGKRNAPVVVVVP